METSPTYALELLLDRFSNDVWVACRDSIGDGGEATRAAIVDEVRRLISAERAACKAEIDKYITVDALQGDGWDDVAQRNGMVLASNLLAARIAIGAG